MSKHETWRTRLFWKTTGGLLLEEFMLVKGSRGQGSGRRLIDGLIVLGEPSAISVGRDFNIEGRDVIAVQTKAQRLGMYLMGQAFFSRELLKQKCPRSIRTVAICAKGDSELEALCKDHGIEVVIIPASRHDEDSFST